MPQTVRAVSLTGFVQVAESVGLDPYALLRSKAINPLSLSDPEARIDATGAVSLLEDAARLSGRDDLSVMMVGYRSFGSLGPLSLLLQHLSDPREVVAALIEYRAMINDLFVLHCELHEETTLLKIGMLNEKAAFQVIGMSVALLHLVLREASGGAWRPDSVHFVHPSSKSAVEFERFFKAPVYFHSTFDGFSCRNSVLEVPNVLADPLRAEHAKQLLAKCDVTWDSGEAVRMTANAVSQLLGTTPATLPNVASSLGMSERSLQRALSAEGTVFADVLNSTRSQVAYRYVTATTLPLSMVAEMAGYSSSATFGRWFSSQFGETPLTARLRLKGKSY